MTNLTFILCKPYVNTYGENHIQRRSAMGRVETLVIDFNRPVAVVEDKAWNDWNWAINGQVALIE